MKMKKIALPKKLVAVGDVHGRYDALRKVVDEKLLEQGYRYVFLGDYLGYGDQSAKVLKYLVGLKARLPRQIFLLFGNWEKLVYQAIYAKEKLHRDAAVQKIVQRGWLHGFEEFKKDKEACSIVKNFIQILDMGFYEGTYCFTHAGVDPALLQGKIMPLPEIIYGSSINHLLWNFEFSAQMRNVRTPYTFIVGHRAVQNLAKDATKVVPFVEGSVVTIDFGAAKESGYLGYIRFDEAGRISFAKTPVLAPTPTDKVVIPSESKPATVQKTA